MTKDERKFDGFQTCGGFQKCNEKREETGVKLIELYQLHKENKDEIDELKTKSDEEMKLLKEIVKELKEEFSGFKNATNIVKYSAITLVLGFLASEMGITELLKTMIGG